MTAAALDVLTSPKLELDRVALFDHFTTEFFSTHGDADGIVPLEALGQRTHKAVPHSTLVAVRGAPHGLNVSHTQEFSDALISFLRT